MEKVQLNNQVVLMRKFVKQAKVHIINKLVKQVKLLQNRKGNEIQVQKAKRKAERFLEEITLIKKMKPDDVSKMALSKSKNWKDVLQQKNSSLNDRCIAMLASYEAVEKEIERFYNSNKTLALKISDLIKQWEDKNRHFKNSPKVKKTCNESRKGNENVQKANVDKNKLKRKNELGTVTNGLLVPEKENSSVTDSHEMKNGSDYKGISKESKISMKSTSNNVSNSDDVSMKESDTKSDHDDEEMENFGKTDEPDSESENTSNSEQSDISNHLEEKMQGKIINSTSDQMKNTTENSDDNDDEDTLNSEESENQDSESETGYAEEALNTNSNIDVEKQGNDVLDYIKKMDSSEKKLKAITLVKLDELDGLDEIPLDASEKDESIESEEESTKEKISVPKSKRNDPFFLGCGDDTADNEEKFRDFSKNEEHSPKKKEFFPNNGPERENNSFFERKEYSNDFSRKRKFQASSNGNKFQKSDSTKFKNQRDNLQSFKKDKFKSRDNQDKFQSKSKDFSGRINFRNQKDFKAKHGHSFSHGKERFENKSSNLYKRDYKGSYPVTPKGLDKEGKADDKPLHPSWEAKRKQKELVNTSFQGKRMVFDD